MWVLFLGFVLPLLILFGVLLALYSRTHRNTGRGSIQRRETTNSQQIMTEDQMRNAPFDQLP